MSDNNCHRSPSHLVLPPGGLLSRVPLLNTLPQSSPFLLPWCCFPNFLGPPLQVPQQNLILSTKLQLLPQEVVGWAWHVSGSVICARMLTCTFSGMCSLTELLGASHPHPHLTSSFLHHKKPQVTVVSCTADNAKPTSRLHCQAVSSFAWDVSPRWLMVNGQGQPFPILPHAPAAG